MVIETDFGKTEIGEPGRCEGEIYVDCDLVTIPEALRERIDEIVRVGKQKEFERRKKKLLEKGYRTLEEMEMDTAIEIETPYLGLNLDWRRHELNVHLNIHGYDTKSGGVLLEFVHTESIMIDSMVALELLFAAARKSAPTEQTIAPDPEELY